MDAAAGGAAACLMVKEKPPAGHLGAAIGLPELALE